MKNILCLILALSMLLVLPMASAETVEAWDTPYEETVTVTVGFQTETTQTVEGQSQTDNEVIRYVENLLNVDVVPAWEVDADNYNTKVAMCIASGDIPDIMVVGRQLFTQLLENDLIQPITEEFEQYLSPFVKQQYATYPDALIERVSYEGEMYAIPGTSLGYNQNLLWIRTDWLDNLGLEVPQTLEELENVARAFIEQDPDGNGEADTLGFSARETLYSTYYGSHGLNSIFAAFGSYPGVWIYDEEGNAVYGSVTEETRAALEYIAKLYADGILDNQFAVKTNTDRAEQIANGTLGMYMGNCWPNSALKTLAANDPDAEWIAVNGPVNAEGNNSWVPSDPAQSYAVVRKGFEHPELLVKMFSAQNNAIRGVDSGKEVYDKMLAENNDAYRTFTWWPVGINVDYYNAYENIMLDHLDAVAAGGDESAMTRTKGFEGEMYQIMRETENHKANIDDWYIYVARIVGPTACMQENTVSVPCAFYDTTESMDLMWTNLNDLEIKTFLKIVMGEEDITAFDTFVQDWYAQGGDIITEEVNESK